jgi:four helix bundle protein
MTLAKTQKGSLMQHRQTRIYRQALELVSVSRKLHDALPPGFAFLRDQLRRASSSVLLNFAEGSGKNTTRDRQRYFRTAKGSAYEVSAIFDVAQTFGFVNDALHAQALDLCDHLGAMLCRYR